ncbi:MAG TPA: hypothetical protein VIL37_17560 [Natronosporangium sp.]
MPETSLPSFTDWSSFPFEGDLRVKKLEEPVAVEPPRKGEDKADCPKCNTPDDAYIWVNENWRVRSMDRPSGLPMVLILESRSHLDLGDLPNMLAAELGVMTVRLERAIRSLDGVARVHVNRWGDAAAHLHVWFMARPYGRLQLRGSFLTLWDEILPPIPEEKWRENLALVAAWLAEFGGQPLAQPPRIDWKAPSSFEQLLEAKDLVIPDLEDDAPEGDTQPDQPAAESASTPPANSDSVKPDPGKPTAVQAPATQTASANHGTGQPVPPPAAPANGGAAAAAQSPARETRQHQPAAAADQS